MPRDEVEDLDQEGGGESDPEGEFATAQEIRERYKRHPGWLEAKVKSGAIRKTKKGARFLYSEADTVKEIEYEQKDQTIVNALAAATNLADQSTKNMQAMFELVQKAQRDLTEELLKALQASRAYVGDLEAQNKEMRELAEKQKTEEHLRKLADIEAEKMQAARDKALRMVEQVGVPLVLSKLGLKMPPNGGPADGGMTALAGMAADWLKSLTPEQWEKLGSVLTPEQLQIIALAKGAIPT